MQAIEIDYRMSIDFSVENDAYIVVSREDFDIAILTGSGFSIDKIDDNVDVEIRYRNGRLLTATFFTLQNIKSLFEKNKKTGECRDGLYFYCTDMILVKELTVENIVKTVEDLVREGYLESAFKSADRRFS